VHHTHRVIGVLSGLFNPADHGAGDVGTGGHDPVGVDDHADDVGAARCDGVQLGVGTTTTGLLADARHQPALFEPLDQLRGGDLAEPGQLT
jgi:hypothetical protein